MGPSPTTAYRASSVLSESQRSNEGSVFRHVVVEPRFVSRHFSEVAVSVTVALSPKTDGGAVGHRKTGRLVSKTRPSPKKLRRTKTLRGACAGISSTPQKRCAERSFASIALGTQRAQASARERFGTDAAVAPNSRHRHLRLRRLPQEE